MLIWRLRILLVLVLLLMLLVVLVGRRTLVLVAISLLVALMRCVVTDRWFTPHFSVVALFCIAAWMADVACPIVCQPIWPACLVRYS